MQLGGELCNETLNQWQKIYTWCNGVSEYDDKNGSSKNDDVANKVESYSKPAVIIRFIQKDK